MAIIVYDGFDHYKTQADLQSRVGKLEWSNVVVPSIPISYVAGRGGYGQAALLESVGGLLAGMGCSFSANYGVGYMGIAIQAQPISPVYFDWRIFDYTNDVVQMTFRFRLDSGLILAYAGDPNVNGGFTLIGSTPPNAFSPYIWNYIECGLNISPSGSFDLHVNGTSVLSASGVGTVNPVVSSPNNFFNGMQIYTGPTSGVGTGVELYIDDFYLCDNTTGAGTYPCNSFLGDVAVRTLFTTGNSAVQWTPLTGANWQEVGETQFDGDTSYNFATTVGYQDTFTFGALPTTVSVVFGVQVTGGYRKQDAGAQTIVQVLKSGSATFNSASPYSLSLSYSFVTDLIVLDPNTSATWTPTNVNAVTCGYKLNS